MSLNYLLALRGGEVLVDNVEPSLPFVRPWYYNGGDPLCGTEIVGESMTDQSQADSVDINRIMASVSRTGIMPPSEAAVYADVTRLQGDFTEMVNESRSVQSVVMEKLNDRAKAEEAEAAADREAGRAARTARNAASSTKEASQAPAKAGGSGDPSGSE